MGVILAPLFLVMLCGFSYPGIGLGVRAVLKARGRLTALLLLLATSASLGMLALVLPFAAVASSEVHIFGFYLGALACVVGIAGPIGAFFAARFRATGKPAAGLAAAACCLAAASVPLSWFACSERLQDWFKVGWIY